MDRRPVRGAGVLLLIFANVLEGCGDDPVRLEARMRDGKLAVTIALARDGHSHLLASEPWRGRDQLTAAAPGIAFRLRAEGNDGAYRVIGSSEVPASQPLSFEVAPELLRDKGLNPGGGGGAGGGELDSAIFLRARSGMRPGRSRRNPLEAHFVPGVVRTRVKSDLDADRSRREVSQRLDGGP
jgi:hypothetical protein